MVDLTPAQLLAATAADMRAVADALDDAKRPWYVENPGGYPQSIRSVGVVYLIADALDQPPYVPTSQYIAAWDPTVTAAVVAMIDGVAARHPTVVLAGGALWCNGCNGPAKEGCPPLREAVALCRAWWASRGVDPIPAES